MQYRIGLDIGITSVGWAVVETDYNGEPINITDMGVRIFERAEQPKTGASLALPRREARGLRRRLRRSTHRVERLNNLFCRSFNDSFENCSADVYGLRYKAITEKITLQELYSILCYFAKHRGFKSNRKSELKEGDAGKLLKATSVNKMYREEKGYRTVGEMIYLDERFFKYETTSSGGKVKRYYTRNGANVYDNTFLRSEIEDEIRFIFAKQKELGLDLSDAFCEKALSIFSSQRAFDEGPGYPSQYKGGFAVGDCPFERGEKRAPKSCYSFELFGCLQKLNNLRIKTSEGSRPLNEIERAMLTAEIKKSKCITYLQVRKKLRLSEDEFFNLISYSSKKSIEDVEKAKLFDMSKSYEIRKRLEVSNALNVGLLDEIGVLISMNKSDDRFIAECRKNEALRGLSQKETDALLELSFSKFGGLSLKAIKKVLPYLEQGEIYSIAMQKAGYDFRNHQNTDKLHLLKGEAITEQINGIEVPVVKRAVSQTIKVINAIVLKYGSPLAINIELAREMSKSFDERNKIQKDNEKRYNANQEALQRIKEEFNVFAPKMLDVLKLRLYEEQGGKCAYSLKPIDASRLFEPTYLQIDHVIPYSRSFNDSYANKVLVLLEENQKKGNRIPFEYFGNTERWRQYEIFVNTYYKSNRRKAEILLKQKFDEDDEKGWKDRNLNDTKYITRFMYNLINDYLEFAPCDAFKKKVVAVNGIITSMLRKIWGISKIRSEGDKHHAVDAAIIAVTTQGMIQRLTRFYKYNENITEENGIFINKMTGEIVEKEKISDLIGIKTMPYESFRNELEVRALDNTNVGDDYLIKKLGYDSKQIDGLKPIFVSRQPNRKIKGLMHEATVRSAKHIEEGIIISKVPLNKLKLSADGEIDGYYNKSSDILLYNALKARMLEFSARGELAKAFEEPIFKPKADGTNGSVVNRVKIVSKASLGFKFEGNSGYADNASMVRVDIFEKNGKYYGVPIYVSDAYKGVLPNKAVVAGKKYDEWDEMDDTYKFLFSLCSNDLIYFEHKEGVSLTMTDKANVALFNNCYLYFKSFSISTASFNCINHDNSYFIPSMGIKTLKTLKKCSVDVLGNISFVKNETRQPIKIN